MLSESARATSAAEARFRVQAPNSAPRRVSVVALDAAGAALAAELAALSWTGARFLNCPITAAGGERLDAFLADLAGTTRRLLEVVEASDLVVMLAGGPEGEAAAAAIGEAAAARRVTAVGIVLAGGKAGAALACALGVLRPHVGMLVVAEDRDYAAAMLEALRA